MKPIKMDFIPRKTLRLYYHFGVYTKSGKYRFMSLEKIFKYSCEVACEELKNLLQKVDQWLMKTRDKAVYRHKGHRKTSIKTLMREVEYSRAVYEVMDGSVQRKFVYFLDEYMGFDCVGFVSSNLAEKNVVCGIESSKDFTMCKKAMTAKIYNTDEIEMRIFNSDGGSWIRTLYEKDDSVCHQLNPFHVNKAIKGVGLGKDFEFNVVNYLKATQIDEMLNYAETVLNSIDNDKEIEKLSELYSYLPNNQDENCNAVIQCFYPGAEGGKALADILYGKVSPSARLPITFYRDINELPPIEDYSMKNRTYKHFCGKVVYPFGHGLTYSDVKEKWLDDNTVEVMNAGPVDIDYTVLQFTYKPY